MEKYAVLAVPLLLLCLMIRVIALPIRALWKLALNAGCGFVCLWLLNSVSGFTGIYFPINAVTVLISGFLGLPGIGLLAVLAVLPG